jgi:hypothetical protein
VRWSRQYVLGRRLDDEFAGEGEVYVPSAALTAEGEEVEDVAVFHLAVRAYGFYVAALHLGVTLAWC